MIDTRLYRVAFMPAVFAIAALMFSVEAAPSGLHPQSAETAVEFDARRAAAFAREIAEVAPLREPGGEGDAISADAVEDRFGEISSGKVSDQPYSGSYDGDSVELRNVILTLPGTSERTNVVVAHRDTAQGPDSTSTAAATGVLVELAAAFARTRHDETLVFVSTDGGAEGASGARKFLDSYLTSELIDAFVVIAQPGPSDPAPPHVLALSAGPQSTSAQLVQSAKAAVQEVATFDAGLEGPLGSLFALALPSGLGEHAALIEEGADAITISGAGERPLHGSQPPSVQSIGAFGRAAFALLVVLDRETGPPAHGPTDYLILGSNLIPGWPIVLLALALILPAGIAAVDGLARASRRDEQVLAAAIWAGERALSFAVPLAFAYLLVLLGIAPAPEFPFDPAHFRFGWRATGVLVVLTAAFVIALLTLHPFRAPAGIAREALAPALGGVATLALVGIWVVNPYLALVLVPFAHVWILAARPSSAVPVLGVAVALCFAAIPLVATIASLVSRLGLGTEAPWQLLLMLTGGQISPLVALLGCLLAGSALGTLAISWATRRRRIAGW